MNYFFKRIFDISLACLGIFFSLPLWGLFALLIWIEDRGPIFYIQERIGKNGQIFKVMKFRTMGKDKKINTYLARLLRVTALDELPQLINIAKGDMSFVGPRPLIKEEMEELKGKKILKERIKGLPGLTGITQVLLFKDAPVEEKFLYDIWYTRHHNFLMDIELIFISYLITFLGRWEVTVDKINIVNRLKKRIDTKSMDIEKVSDA